jgi:hypothetical protein
VLVDRGSRVKFAIPAPPRCPERVAVGAVDPGPLGAAQAQEALAKDE